MHVNSKSVSTVPLFPPAYKENINPEEKECNNAEIKTCTTFLTSNL